MVVGSRPVWRGAFEPLLALLIALTAGWLILSVSGHQPWIVTREFAERTLLRQAGIEESIVRAVPLLIVGVAILIAARTGTWNIGVDGQVIAGAIAAAEVGHALADLPRPLMWVGAAVAGMVAGALWMAVPAILRARFGINEIITTIMFNYLAYSLGSWLVKGPFKDESLVSPQTAGVVREDRLARFGDTKVHIGILVAIALVAIAGWWLSRTESGFEARMTGESLRAARHAMVPVSVLICCVMLASGALAGLAGANDILATRGTYQAEWSPGYGLVGFALVFLARRSALGLIPAALFLGILAYGGDVLPRAADVPAAFVPMLEGLVLIGLSIVGSRRRLAQRFDQ